MSAIQAKARKTMVTRLAAVAGGLLVIMLAASMLSGGATEKHPRTGDPVFPGLMSETGSAPTIRVTTADTSYTLKKSPMGWGMVEAGGYAVREDRMAALAEGLSQISWGKPMTRDPAKFERISLSDPRENGSGALVEIIGEDGEAKGALITGTKDQFTYGRLPSDEALTFRIDGELPPFYTKQAWLDLDVVDIPQEVIKSVRLTRGPDSLYLERPTGGGPRTFRPAPPNQNDRLVSRLAAAGPALAITRLYPVDVKPVTELTTKAIARHITVTHDALEVDVQAHVEPDGYYITLRAVEAGNGANRAESINAKAEGWAFKLSEYDWQDFAPNINTIVRRAPSQN